MMQRHHMRYSTVVITLLLGHVLDVLSTEVILHHGRVGGVEANKLVAELHDGGGVWLFRSITFAVVALLLYIFRPSAMDMERIRELSFWGFILNKHKTLPLNLQIKISILVIVAVLSVHRFLAGLSNICGEIFNLSLPIIFDRYLGMGSSSSVYTASVITSVTLSIVMIGLAWTQFQATERKANSS